MGKYTLLLTQQCNLRCEYCYVEKRNAQMPLDILGKVVDFIYANSPPSEKIDIGFFGGEPLLEFALLKQATALIKSHPAYSGRDVVLSVISNGTVFSDEIADFLAGEQIQLCISCDGPPAAQDSARRFVNGSPSSPAVERTIRKAVEMFPVMRVNAVFHPRTLRQLPDTVAYLAGLGVNQIYLNPDFPRPGRRTTWPG